jgi:molybdopterin/thiamine biosynthesis adenylyltransferase
LTGYRNESFFLWLAIALFIICDFSDILLVLLRGGELRLDDMNRQILMTDDWVGKPRVFKAQETLEAINPDVCVEAICEYVTPENVDYLVKGADIAIDCAHNFTERDLLNEACVRWNKPMVEAAMNGMEAYLTTIVPGVTGCLSCLFPEKPEWDRRGFGVLGAVPGTLACLAALEAIKLITGCDRPLLRLKLATDPCNWTIRCSDRSMFALPDRSNRPQS